MSTQTEDRFNTIVFEEKIRRALAGQVKGYSAVIANKAGIQAKVSGGWAQAPGDGNVPMKTYITSGIGSVSKVLTATALLHLFDRHKLSDATVQDQLDMSIWDKLPLKWRETTLAGKNFKKVTYRLLLQHKSGIVSDNTKVPKKYRDNKIGFYFICQQGVDENKLGKREYNNYGMSLVGHLIAAIAYPKQIAKFHQEHKHLDHFEYTKALRIESLGLYEKYMREEIFSHALESISPTCRPEGEASNKYAKSYADINDKVGISPQRKAPCNSQGGWFLSAQELSQFARTLAFTNRYIGPTTRDSLYDPTNSQTRDERIVYSSQLAHSKFEAELGQSHWPYHGGDVFDYKTAFVKLPYGHYGVAMVNSNGKSSGDLARLLLNSFYDSTRNKPISLDKHGLTEGKYQQYVSELSEHGSMPDWIDFYNVGDNVYVNATFRPAKTGWLARHNLNGKEYRAMCDKYITNGAYKFHQVVTYVKSGQIRYAAILIKGSSANMPFYFGITAAEHQKKIDDWTSRGFVPVNMSVTSIGGDRRYAAFYEKKTVAGWAAKSFLTGKEYQAFVDEQIKAKREIAYLKSYSHKGDIRFSAIFYGNINRRQVLRHNMSSSGYQSEYDKWVSQGYVLKQVTAAKGNHTRFAAVWQK